MKALNKRVLVIDDDPDFLQLVRALLQRVVAEVLVEGDAASGLDAVRARRPDLILCDVDMPGISGFELRRRLRADPLLAELPFLFISRRTSTADHLEGLRLGATDYLTKPVSPEALIARVIHLLDRAEAGAPDLLLDEAEHDAQIASGSLSALPLVELLQVLEAGAASGVLALDGQGVAGRMVLSGGVVAAADAGAMSGEDAALTLLGLREGRFSFQRGPASSAGQGLQVRALLMDAAWIEDELTQLGAQAPLPDAVIEIARPAGASALFPGSEAWQALVADEAGAPRSLSLLAEAIGIGVLRARVLVGHGVKNGCLVIR
jgi:CheY-like chemotaxis protein